MMCFMAGANAVFTGEKMLTTACNGWEEDKEMFEKWGLMPMETREVVQEQQQFVEGKLAILDSPSNPVRSQPQYSCRRQTKFDFMLSVRSAPTWLPVGRFLYYCVSAVFYQCMKVLHANTQIPGAFS